MGLLDWFSKKRPSTPPPSINDEPPRLDLTALPKPDKVTPLGDNSPMLGFEHNGQFIVMDRDTYDYLYSERSLPDPAQRDLDEVLRGVTTVCILDGGLYRGNAMSSSVFAWVTKPNEISLLRESLRILEDPGTFGHCHCVGGPTLECYAGPNLVATISLQHGKAIRWNRWHHDAVLADGQQLTQWLLRQDIREQALQAVFTRGNNHLLSEPPDKAYWMALAEIMKLTTELGQQGRLTEVLPYIDRLIKDHPQRSEPYGMRANVNDSLGNYAALVTDLDAAFDLGLRNDSLLYHRARVKMMLGQPDIGVAGCSHALLYAADRPDVYNVRATCYANLGKTDEALADWKRAIDLKPDWVMPYMLRSQLNHQLANLDQARLDIDKAIELMNTVGPSQAGAMAALAELLIQRGDIRYDCFQPNEAEADFAAACRLHPQLTGRVGELWQRRGQSDKAAAAFTRAIEFFPDDPRGYAARANLYMNQGQWDKALPDCDVVIRLAPDMNGHGARGIVLAQLLRHDEALREFTTQLEKTPDDLCSLLTRAGLSSKLGRFAESLQDRERAFQLAPENPAVLNMLAWLLATSPMDSQRQGPRAVELAQKSCELTEWKDSNMIDTLAAACAEVGRFEDAVKYQTQVIGMPVPAPESFLQGRRDRLVLYQAGQPFRESAVV
jgi:tetratricopeptide (TPR) repeat protein